MHRLNPDRLRGALRVHGLRLADLARVLGVCESHVRRVLAGERRVTQDLIDGVRLLLGDEAAAFVLGRSDVLPVPATMGGAA